MDINEFESVNSCDKKEFMCGIKFIPKKTLNKSTDGMFIFKEKYITGEDEITLHFKRSYEGFLKSSKFVLSNLQIEKFIEFMDNFYNKYDENFEEKNEEEFIIQNEGKITLNVVSVEYVKICAIKMDNINSDRVFFRLHKDELDAYIKTLNSIYLNNNLVNSLNYELENLLNPLTKEERDNLYISALYAFIDSALDNNDMEAFYRISNQIKEILE